MKSKLPFVLLGAVVGVVLGYFIFHRTAPETETKVEYRYIVRSAADLHPVELKVPEVKVPELAYFTEYETVVRHDTTTIVLPRKHFFLDEDGAKIWYSGVDPTIDSLMVSQKIVTEYVHPENKQHSVGLFGGFGWKQDFSFPLGVYYSYKPYRWLEVGVQLDYDFFRKSPEIMAGVRIPVVRF